MDGFEEVTHSILIRRAPEPPPIRESANTLTQSDPALIVVCSWVAAHLKHVAKYTDTYVKDYPNSTILVIQTSLKAVLFSPSDKAQQQRIRPASDIINRSTSPIFFHVFSNGGTVAVSQILQSLTSDRRAAIQAFVFDSCPGRATYHRIVQAVITSAPKQLRLVLPSVVYPALLPQALLGKVGVENVISKGRMRLNDKAIAYPGIPRLYLYSKADKMIWWEDARDHAAEARDAGYQDVRELVFTSSQHCAHIQENPDKYWKAVKDIAESHVSNRTAKL